MISRVPSHRSLLLPLLLALAACDVPAPGTGTSNDASAPPAAAPAIAAMCGKDTDCKGDRVCEQGQCVNPPTTTPVAADSTTTSHPRFQPFLDPRGKISMGDCRMEECSWAMWRAVDVIERSNEEILLRVFLLGGSSTHAGGEYPDNHEGVKIEWNSEPHQVDVRCSFSKPALINDGRTDSLPLNKDGNIPGVLTSSVELYMAACHSDFGGYPAALERYNYQVPDEYAN